MKKDGNDIGGRRCFGGEIGKLGFSKKDRKRAWTYHMKILHKENDWNHKIEIIPKTIIGADFFLIYLGMTQFTYEAWWALLGGLSTFSDLSELVGRGCTVALSYVNFSIDCI